MEDSLYWTVNCFCCSFSLFPDEYVQSLLVYSTTYISDSFSGKLVNALLSGLSDRSAGVRKAYAGAAGHLVKVTTKFVLNSNYITLCV